MNGFRNGKQACPAGFPYRRAVRRAPSSTRPLGWLIALPALTFLGVFLIWPLIKVMRVGGINLGVWTDPYFLGRLGWTLGQAGLTVLLGALIAWPLAYLLSRHAVPGKRGLLRLLLLPFVTPTLVAVLGLTALLGPRGWLTQLTGHRPLGKPGADHSGQPVLQSADHAAAGLRRLCPRAAEPDRRGPHAGGQ